MTFRGLYGFFSLTFCFIIVAWAVLGAGCSVKEREMDQPLIGLSTDRPKYRPDELEKGFDPTKLEVAFFEYNRADLTPDAKDALKQTALWLKAHKDASLQIEGYCDERGGYDYNLKLGEKRAAATKAFLVKLGVAPKRLSTVSVGKVAGQQWSANRRAGLVVIYDR